MFYNYIQYIQYLQLCSCPLHNDNSPTLRSYLNIISKHVRIPESFNNPGYEGLYFSRPGNLSINSRQGIIDNTFTAENTC